MPDIFTIAKRFFLLILGLAVAGVFAGLALTKVVEPEYDASAQLLVSVVGARESSDLEAGSSHIMRQMPSYAAVAQSPRVLDAVSRRLGLDGAHRSELASVTATVPADTSLLTVQATASNPGNAARYANAVADEVSRTIPGLFGSTSAGVGSRVSIVGTAVAPTSPTSPRPALFAALGLVIGAGAGVGLAAALVAVRQRRSSTGRRRS